MKKKFAADKAAKAGGEGEKKAECEKHLFPKSTYNPLP